MVLFVFFLIFHFLLTFIDDWRNNKLTMEMQALNVAISSFATWQACEPNPTWIMAKNKAFRSVSLILCVF